MELVKNMKNKEEQVKVKTENKEETKESLPENEKEVKVSIKIVGLTMVIAVFILFFLLTRQASEPDIPINNTFQPESYKYNGFLFQKGMYAWYSKIKIGDSVYDVSFVYGPKEVDNISVIGKVNDLILKANEIYVTTEPDYPSKIGKAQVEISKITSPRTANFGILNIPTINTVTEIPDNLKGIVNYPEITCENATSNTSVIYLKIGSETRIYNDSYCVIVEGSNDDEVVKAADRLVYNLLGIIK